MPKPERQKWYLGLYNFFGGATVTSMTRGQVTSVGYFYDGSNPLSLRKDVAFLCFWGNFVYTVPSIYTKPDLPRSHSLSTVTVKQSRNAKRKTSQNRCVWLP